LEIGEMQVISDLQLAAGKHTLDVADDRHRYEFELLQQGSNWFHARVATQRSGRWWSTIRTRLRF
jgi:hypothetical protein